MPSEQRVEVLIEKSAVFEHHEQSDVEYYRRHNSDLGFLRAFVFLDIERIQVINRTREQQKENPYRFAPRIKHKGEKRGE